MFQLSRKKDWVYIIYISKFWDKKSELRYANVHLWERNLNCDMQMCIFGNKIWIAIYKCAFLGTKSELRYANVHFWEQNLNGELLSYNSAYFSQLRVCIPLFWFYNSQFWVYIMLFWENKCRITRLKLSQMRVCMTFFYFFIQWQKQASIPNGNKQD